MMRTVLSALAVLAVALPALTQPGFAQPAPAQAPPAPTAGPLRLSGSSTVGDKLAPALVSEWFKRAGYPSIRVVEGKSEEAEIVAEGAEKGEPLRASINAHGTGSGLADLVAGKADLWMASRQPTRAELDAAAKANIRPLDAANERTIALDGLRVIVNRDNRVTRLTMAQISDLFSGKVTRWSDVGGADLPVALYGRNPASGAYDTFASLVFEPGRKMGTAKVLPTNEDLADAVASDPGGIGFVAFAYERNAKSIDIVTSCGLAVSPSAFTVKAFEYPLSRRLYLYTGATMTPDVGKFLEFVQSLDAQPTVARAGFVDFSQAASDARYNGRRLDTAGDARDGGRTVVRETDLQELEDATSGAARLATTFRFVAGSDRLDSQALADVDRLAQGLKAAPYTGFKVTLIGFTTSQGSYTENRIISRQRAEVVRQALEGKGVKITSSTGVGPAAPVACNTDPATRALNQRVEVWVQKP